MNSILENQKSERMLRILLAGRKAYSKSKRIFWLEWILVIIALAGAIMIPLNFHKEIVALGSLSISITLTVFMAYFKRQTKIGAGLQEMFDTELFELAWNKTLTGKKIINEQFFNTANTKKEVKPEDPYYSKEISEKVPHNIAVLLCIKCNTIFNTHQRGLYINAWRILLIAFIVGSVIVAFNVQKLSDFVIYLAPTIPFLNLVFTKINAHLEVYEKYKHIDSIVDDYIEKYKDEGKSPELSELRAIQDLMYLVRSVPVKVADYFYSLFNSESNAVTDECIADIVKSFKLK